MRVLYLADLNGYSHDKKWIRYLAAQPDIDCYVICTRDNYRKLKEVEILEFQANQIRLLKPVDYFSLRRIYRTFRSLRYLLKVIRDYQIDLIHIMYIDPNGLWGVFRKFIDCHVIMTTRGSDVYIGLKNVIARQTILNRILFRLYKVALSNADWITSTSHDQLLKLQQAFSLETPQSVIRTGAKIAETSDIDKDVSQFGLSTKKYVFFPRSMRSIYNHELAIDAIVHLPDEIKSNFTFVFVNRDSTDYDYVERINRMMMINQTINWKFLTTRTNFEMAILYSHASLVVMTPLSDGSPVSAMEAMMYKAPVILPPLNYDREIFGQWVFHLKAWDYSELSHLMTDILLGKVSIHEKIEKAYNTVMEKGNFTVEMGNVIALYHKLVNK